MELREDTDAWDIYKTMQEWYQFKHDIRSSKKGKYHHDQAGTAMWKQTVDDYFSELTYYRCWVAEATIKIFMQHDWQPG
jgi:hypothetical protein